jgi:TRAP-type C4-dicarboxylate transport system permease small subunit
LRVAIVRKAAEKLLCGQIVPAFFLRIIQYSAGGGEIMWQITSLEQKRWWKALLSLENAILIITSILVATIVTIGVIMRYILHINFIGEEEILAVLAMWLYWVGGIVGSYTNTHITADLLDTFVTDHRKRKVINAIALLISIAVICVFVVWGYKYTIWSYKLGGKSTGLKIPLIISKVTMFIGFVLMGFYSIYHFIRVLQRKETDNQKGD